MEVLSVLASAVTRTLLLHCLAATGSRAPREKNWTAQNLLFVFRKLVETGLAEDVDKKFRCASAFREVATRRVLAQKSAREAVQGASVSIHGREGSGTCPKAMIHKVRSLERGGKTVWIAGAGDLWEDHRDVDVLLRGIPEADCRIVLAHNPDTADTGFGGRTDLMISGHTHGGQVNIPFLGPPVLPVRNKTYSSGLKTSTRGARVFISRGIGWAIYPVRFNCPPEIAVLELVPDKSGPGHPGTSP
ncbi:MAG: hypothetical protein HY900_05860 [Deltaproteobacteria bacterium]|nr:hypothetical protein [Deltaproteobacteria bacterium]